MLVKVLEARMLILDGCLTEWLQEVCGALPVGGRHGPDKAVGTRRSPNPTSSGVGGGDDFAVVDALDEFELVKRDAGTDHEEAVESVAELHDFS